jgi:hypothetical protein
MVPRSSPQRSCARPKKFGGDSPDFGTAFLVKESGAICKPWKLCERKLYRLNEKNRIDRMKVPIRPLVFLIVLLGPTGSFCQEAEHERLQGERNLQTSEKKTWSFELLPPRLQVTYGDRDPVVPEYQNGWWIQAWPPEYGSWNGKLVRICSPWERLRAIVLSPAK